MSLSVADTCLIIASIVLNAFLFILFQCAAIRIVRPSRLLVHSVLVFIISSLFFLATCSLTVRFSSSFDFINFGVIVLVGSVGICGLYTFLGPATADRSATAHLLVFLLTRGNVKTDIIDQAFDARAFIDKRFTECSQANILTVNNGMVSLTAKGGRLAQVYSLMAEKYRIQRLSGYSCLFVQAQQGVKQ